MECSLDTSFRHVFWTSHHKSLSRLRLIKDEKAIESMPLLYIKDIVYEMKRWYHGCEMLPQVDFNMMSWDVYRPWILIRNEPKQWSLSFPMPNKQSGAVSMTLTQFARHWRNFQDIAFTRNLHDIDRALFWRRNDSKMSVENDRGLKRGDGLSRSWWLNTSQAWEIIFTSSFQT